jgi:hypothetical protein
MNTEDLLALEEGRLSEGETIALFQHLIDEGIVWKMPGSYGRTAMDLMEQGCCMLGPVGHFDYYGNYVPSRHEVKPGTKGSAEYSKEHAASRDAF